VRKDDLIVFIEVKSRNTSRFGGPLYAVGPRKKRALRAAARHFLVNNPFLDKKEITLRFDLIAVQDGALEWIQDIIR
jgi:putative endonuclease